MSNVMAALSLHCWPLTLHLSSQTCIMKFDAVYQFMAHFSHSVHFSVSGSTLTYHNAGSATWCAFSDIYGCMHPFMQKYRPDAQTAFFSRSNMEHVTEMCEYVLLPSWYHFIYVVVVYVELTIQLVPYLGTTEQRSGVWTVSKTVVKPGWQCIRESRTCTIMSAVMACHVSVLWFVWRLAVPHCFIFEYETAQCFWT